MMNYMDRLHTDRKTLRELMEEKPVFSPCVFNPRTAMMTEAAGFEAMCFSGGNFASSFGGVADIGLMTPTEIRTMVSNITKVTSIPMIVDMDTGYGNELNSIRTAVDFAEAGAMALHFEDQVFPKRCGHLQGKQVISREDYFKKIRAVADALKGGDCMLIARTDCYLQYGADEAIARANGALECGADIAFVEGTRSIRDIERIGREVRGWNMFDMLHGGASPDVSFEDPVRMGYRLVTCPKLTHHIFVAYAEILKRGMETKNDSFLEEYGFDPEKNYEELFQPAAWLRAAEHYNPSLF